MEATAIVPTLSITCPHCSAPILVEVRDDLPSASVGCLECGEVVRLVVEEEKVKEHWRLVAEMEVSDEG